LTRTLGTVRALDVNLQLLRAARKRLQPETRETQVRAARMLLAERAAAVKDVQELSAMLRKSGFAARLERMIRYTRHQLHSKRLLNTVREELERLRDVARRREKTWEQKQSRRAFHRLRIAVKKYRYALEVAEGVFGSSVKSRLDAVEDLQDLMGACHDVEVLLEWFDAAKWEKALAKPVGWITGCLREDFEQCRHEAVRFLKKERIWMKKVRLECNHE
jgi:CHAD domain-containing protein